NVTDGSGVSHWWDNGNNQIAFSRGNKGFVAINREGGTLARTFSTGLPDGNYRNVAGDGSCITVQGGQVSLSVAPMEAAALHVGAACDGNDGSDEGNNGNGSDAEQASVAFQCSNEIGRASCRERVWVAWMS